MPLTTAFHRRYTVYSRRQRRQPKSDAHAVVHVQRRPTSEAGGESVLPAGELPVPGGEHHHHHEQGRAGPAPRSSFVALLHHTQRYASVARLAGAAHRRSRCVKLFTRRYTRSWAGTRGWPPQEAPRPLSVVLDEACWNLLNQIIMIAIHSKSQVGRARISIFSTPLMDLVILSISPVMLSLLYLLTCKDNWTLPWEQDTLTSGTNCTKAAFTDAAVTRSFMACCDSGVV